MKNIFLAIMLTVSLFAWEINTHRAVDQEALKDVPNLDKFVKKSQIQDYEYKNNEIEFEGYNLTYTQYVEEGEEAGISSEKWKQEFVDNKYQSLIEAGVILEDAQWYPYDEDAPSLPIVGFDWAVYTYSLADGRFNNHFYDAQDNGNDLTFGLHVKSNALEWAKEGAANFYTYDLAYQYMELGFSHSDLSERRRYQAKAFVSVGHVIHMMNDMSSTAHTRNDSHPEGDPMEVWGRGGENGNLPMGFRTKGGDNAAYGSYEVSDAPKYTSFEDFIKNEAYYTATNFFSSDTILKNGYLPNENKIKEECSEIENGLEKCYIKHKEHGKKLAIRLKSNIIRVIDEIYPGDQSRTIRLGTGRSMRGDYTVLEENAAVLLPRAIANARNFVNYFFRGSIESVANPCAVTVTNDSDDSLVADANVVTFEKGGIMSVYYDIGDTKTRVKLTEYELTKNLAKNDSVTIPLRIDTDLMDKIGENKYLTVVYSGTIGTEEGIAVDVASLDGIEPYDSVPPQDGIITVDLTWEDSDIDMNLEVEMPFGTQDIKDVGCPLEHYFVATEEDVEPGTYPVYVRTNTSDINESVIPQNVDLIIHTPGEAMTFDFNITSVDLLNIGHVANIIIEEDKEVHFEPTSSSAVSGVITHYGGGYTPYTNYIYEIVSKLKQALMGPLSNAGMELREAKGFESNTPLYVGTTSGGESLTTSGLLHFPSDVLNTLDNEKFYVVSIIGGNDIDANDDGKIDNNITTSEGTIHAIISGKRLKTENFKINILTEAVYQLTKEMLTDDLNTTTMTKKIDYISKKLLKSDVDKNNVINYDDVLWWVPLNDKDKLRKKYNKNYQPIAEKIYRNEDIYENAKELINIPYETYLNENAQIGAVLKDFSTDFMGDSTTYSLSGAGSENFIIDINGTLRLKESNVLDYETFEEYTLQIIVSDSYGNDFYETIHISIGNIIESVPVLNALLTVDINEDAPIGTVLTTVKANGKNSDENTTDHFSIVGGNVESFFDIDENGTITLITPLNYETQNDYWLEVTATNVIGESDPMRITVNEIRTNEIILSIEDNALIGTALGAVFIDDIDENTVDSYTIISGNTNDTFEISNSGVIKTARELNYNEVQTYILKLIAYTQAGDNIPVNVVINVYKGEETLQPFLIAKKTASDIEPFDVFGSVVFVSGNLILVGAPYENEKGSLSGAAYLFEKDENGNVNEIAKLTASDGASYENFGSLVAISGDVLLVSSGTGVYLFEKNTDNTVTERGKFFTQNSDAIAIDGNLIAVGIVNDNNVGAVYVFEKDANFSVNELIKLTASDAESYDQFGSAVAIDNKQIVVGAPFEDEIASNTGAAYLFKQDINGSFMEIKKIMASDGELNDNFGSAVAINNNQIVVGAPAEDEIATNAGAAYLFEIGDNGEVVELEKLIAINGNAYDNFATSVTITKDLIGIGSPTSDQKGAMYLFQRGNNESTLALEKLIAPDGEYYDNFATSVAISDSMIAVGTPHRRVQNLLAGSLYVFDTKPLHKIYVYSDQNISIDVKEEYTGTVYSVDAASPDGELSYMIDSSYATMKDNNLTLMTKLDFENPQDDNADNIYHTSITLSDDYGQEAIVNLDINVIDSVVLEVAKSVASDGKSYDRFGTTVAVSGDYILAGSNGAGAAYLFKKEDDGTVRELGKITASDGIIDYQFGEYIAINGDTIAIGVPNDNDKGSSAGAVYLYSIDSNDDIISLGKLTAEDTKSEDTFGGSVAIHDDFIVVGAFRGNGNVTGSGAVYLFKKDVNGMISELAKFTASDAYEYDTFGTSVSIDGDFIVVGAYRESQNGRNAGAAYLFKKDSSGNVIELEKITASNGAAYDEFAKSVSISGSYFVIGAKGHENGMAYLYAIDASDNVLEVGRITASDGEKYDEFGKSVSIYNDHIIVGALYEGEQDSYVGAAYLYEKDTYNVITELEKVTASDGGYEDYFGTCVAIDGSHIVIGAPNENEKGISAGAFYLYDKVPGL